MHLWDGKVTSIFKNEKYRNLESVHPLNAKRALKNWNKINSEFILQIGNKDYIKNLEKRYKIAQLKFDAQATGNMFFLTMAELLEAE